MTYLDTHVVVFLHNGAMSKLSQRAKSQIESDDILISPMVLLELEMLKEKGVLLADSQRIVGDLASSIGLSVCQLPMAHVIQKAIPLKWTRDPGDRLIVANALAANEAPLISKDATIREFYKNTIW